MKATHIITYKWNYKTGAYEMLIDGQHKLGFDCLVSLLKAVELCDEFVAGAFFVEGLPASEWLDMMWNSIGESPVRHEFWS